MSVNKLRPQERLYIALGDFDLSFTRGEVAAVVEAWRRGDSVPDIAEQLGRDQHEIAVLLIDLGIRGRIEARPGGVRGREAW